MGSNVTVDEVWRRKSDEELLAAVAALSECTVAGREAILAELQRRREAGVLDLELKRSLSAQETEGEGPRRDSNIVVRLWRGDIPLVRTFWGFWFGGVVLLRALIFAGYSVTRTSLITWYLLAVFVAYIGHQVLTLVAIWRSAGQYPGDAPWAALARTVVVLNVFGIAIRVMLSLSASTR